MKRIFCSLCVVASLAIAAQVPAFAADDAAKMQKLEERFKAADKNGDGKLTKAEAEAGMPRLAKNFDSIDTDKKGYVTLDQVKAAMAAMRQSGGGK
ncbi:MAG TPA: EF-hand domain-containing protein [Janthinobacterium sp.]|jgi:Ca2+-binding EF-hand superfamily protein|nr:EF-hand domain-containing protein [Janthinobacterium sp.]